MTYKSMCELIEDNLAALKSMEKPATKFVLDVSSHQGKIDWDLVFENPNIVGVNVRAGGGYWDDNINNLDKEFIENCKRILDAGKKLGTYYYLYAVPNLNKLYRQLDSFEGFISEFRDQLDLGVYLDWEDKNFFGIDYLPSWYWYAGHIKTMIESSEYDNYTSKYKFDSVTAAQKIKPYCGYGTRWIAQYYYGSRDIYDLRKSADYGTNILKFYSQYIIGAEYDSNLQVPSIPVMWKYAEPKRYWDI